MKDKLALQFIDAAIRDKNYVIRRVLPALYAARRAILTAITSEDGLDGAEGERVEKKLNEAIKTARFMFSPEVKPKAPR